MINSFVIFSYKEKKINLLTYKRSVVQGLITMSRPETIPRIRKSTTSPANKRRRHSYSVSNDIRLTNLGVHWPEYNKERGRCEFCSANGIQSRPYSKCSICRVNLCCNEKKKLFYALSSKITMIILQNTYLYWKIK